MIIKDVMRTSVITVTPETTVTEAKELMTKNNISKLPVLDHDKLVGIITKNDLLKAGPSQATTLDMYEISYLLSKLTVKKAMCAKVISVSPSEVVEEAARIMVDNQIGCLPVVKDGVLVGIVTENDLFHLFTEMFGSRSKGVRAVLIVDDKPGQIVKLTKLIADVSGNIVSAVTTEMESTGKRRLTIKICGVDLNKVKEIIEECAFEVEDLRVL